MGKASRRKKLARVFREEQGLTKNEWKLSIRESKQNVNYGSVPVIRKKWKVGKHPKVNETA